MKQTNGGSIYISLLIFTIVGLIITGVAVSLTLDAIIKSSKLKDASIALNIAESGMENAILRLLRDPSYTEEVLDIGDGSATISVTGSDPFIVRSVGQIREFKRTIQANLSRTNGVLSVDSWEEVEQ